MENQQTQTDNEEQKNDRERIEAKKLVLESMETADSFIVIAVKKEQTDKDKREISVHCHVRGDVVPSMINCLKDVSKSLMLDQLSMLLDAAKESLRGKQDSKPS